MKKVLSLLASVALTTAASVGVVSCASKKVNNGSSSNGNNENNGLVGNPYVLMFTNGNDSSQNSKYRLLGRHQDGYVNPDLNIKWGGKGKSANTWENELGLQLDNSNPVVQAEQLNWLYYLLFYSKNKQAENANGSEFIASKNDYEKNAVDSTFDGARIDCIDGTDSDVIKQTAQLMDELYGRTKSDANANDHLGFNEGFGPDDQHNESKYFYNSALDYDDSYYQNMTSHLMWYGDDSAPSLNGADALISNKWYDDETENDINPNITYSQNHDNFKGRITTIAWLIDHGFSFHNYNDHQQEVMKEASEKYYDNLRSADKTWQGMQISPKNQIALYADMLMNKDTVPIVFYGDLFESEKPYMQTPSAIAEPIMDILRSRSQYVAGGQQRRTVDNGDIITNVRFGKDYYDGITKNSDPAYSLSKNSGMVTVYSNNKSVNKMIKVYVGKNHANQQFKNLIDTDSSNDNNYGLTLGNAASKSTKVMGVDTQKQDQLPRVDTGLKTVDSDGNLTINVKGTNKAFVDGYLGIWVPNAAPSNINVTEQQAKSVNTFAHTGKELNSNAALDGHVIYQDFDVSVPNQGLSEDEQQNDCYAEVGNHAQDIVDSGITDVWMAPPYVSPDQSKNDSLLSWVASYGYGYMMSDRYNLGDGNTPSKYGTSSQLIEATKKLHAAYSDPNTINEGINGRSLKVMLDLVPHQIIGGDKTENVTFDEYVDRNKKGFAAPLDKIASNRTDTLYTATSDKNMQYIYGGKYLDTLHNLYPDLFSTPALSTGECVPWDTKIRNWSVKYEDDYPLEFGVVPSANNGNNSNGIYVVKPKEL